MDRSLVIIMHNIRSCHNVGSLFRTADGLGVAKIYCTGYTPYPQSDTDDRLPHIAIKAHNMIAKTALGAEETMPWEHSELEQVIEKLRDEGYTIVALEQTPQAKKLHQYKPKDKIALLLGSERDGLDKASLKLTDEHVVIPMLGKKESFNVVQAAAMALYQLRFA